MNAFITGTGTGCGKTYTTCLLLEALRAAGRRAVGYKPVVCGTREDAHALVQASGGAVSLDECNPLWFKLPASPRAAALVEARDPDPAALVAGCHRLAAQHEIVLVEGAGGWEVPLTATLTMADLAQSLGLPVVIVVDNRLGCLNHTILTAKAITARGLRVLGLVLNSVSVERDAASISTRLLLSEALPGVPILAEIMHGETALDPREVDALLGASA